MSGRGGSHTQLPRIPAPYPPVDGSQPCRDVDPERFFPHTANEQYYADLRDGCDVCPFLAECREYAITHDLNGFWGGMSETERIAERVQRGIAPVPGSTSDGRILTQLLSELDDGVSSSREVAARVGCSSATVLRHRKRQAAA